MNTNEFFNEQPDNRGYQNDQQSNGGQQRNNWQGNNGGGGYNKPSYNGNGGNKSGYNNNGGGGYNKPSYNGGGGGGYNKQKFYKKPEEDFDEANVHLYRTYVGTGNREAPPQILDRMSEIAKELERFNYTVRTGGFEGPEEAFESSVKNYELHLPWRDFNGKESKSYFNTKEALALAKMFHPAFDGLKPAIQAFLAKNVRMIMGKELKSPTMFVICWSEDGVEHANDRTAKTGNVGHTISLASAMHIPVFNLGNPTAESRLRTFLELPNGRQEQTTNEQQY